MWDQSPVLGYRFPHGAVRYWQPEYSLHCGEGLTSSEPECLL